MFGFRAPGWGDDESKNGPSPKKPSGLRRSRTHGRAAHKPDFHQLAFEPLEPRAVFSATPFDADDVHALAAGAPQVVAFVGDPPTTLTTGTSLTYTLTFSEAVTGLEQSDFTVLKTGTASYGAILILQLNPSVYRIVVSGITGDGTLELNLVDDRTIRDSESNTLDVAGRPFTFLASRSYATNSGPLSIASGDFNGDGNLDLVDFDAFVLTFSIRLGNGDGTFQAQRTIALATGTGLALAVGDFNGDGRADIAAAHSTNGTFVLLSNGDGTFQAPQTILAVATTVALAKGDLNGDGKLDVVVSTGTDPMVLLGNGNGTFQSPTTIVMGANQRHVYLADLDGNGALDLVALGSSSGTISAALGNGDGTFQARRTAGVGFLPYSTTIGDFDGDGKLDLAAVNSSATSSVALLLGNGDGTFKVRPTFSLGVQTQSITSGDFNSDGKLDLALAAVSTNSMWLISGNGDGTFQTPQTFGVGTSPRRIATGDFNGDGVGDLVVTNTDSASFTTFIAAARFSAGVVTLDHTRPTVLSIRPSGQDSNAGATTVSFTVTFSETVTGVDAGDFAVALSGVTTSALVVTQVSGSVYTVTIDGIAGVGSLGLNLVDDDSIRDVAGNHWGSGPGLVFQATQSKALGFAPFAMAVGDFNGDGRLDTAVTQSPGNQLTIMLGNGNGTFLARESYQTGSSPIAISTGDVNSDGRVDLLTLDGGGSGSLSVLLGNGDGTFQARRSFSTVNAFGSVTVGDFNGDGKPDALVGGGSAVGYSYATVRLLLGNGDGNFKPAQQITAGILAPFVTVADLNSDGKLDFVIGNKSLGFGQIFLGNGNGTFQAPQAVAGISNSSVAVVGDLNGDGRLDLAAANVNGTVSVLIGNSDGSYGLWQSNPPPGIYSIAILDADGDGKPDIAVASATSPSSVGILLGNGNGTFQTTTTYATGLTPKVTSGDFNGDGRTDLLTINRGTSSLGVMLNDSKKTFIGESFDINRTKLLTIEPIAPTGTTTNASNVSFRVTFSGDVTGVTSAAFEARRTGSIETKTINVTAVSGSEYIITVGGISGIGTVGLNFYYNSTIKDAAGLTIEKAGASTMLRDALSVEAGSSPFYGGVSVASADLNGDGKLDVVVGGYSSIRVLLGNGNGSFRAGQSISTGANAYGAKLADFNGDGKLDLAVTLRNSGTVSMHLGNGNGTFQTGMQFGTLSTPTFLKVADFNGDGRLDFLVGSINSSTSLSMLLGNGNGTFAAASSIGIAETPLSIATGDFNGDGTLDIAVQSANSRVRVLFNNGAAKFPTSQTFTTLFGSHSIAAADVDLDGKVDLVIGGDQNGIGLFLSNGNGTFRAPSTFAAGTLQYPSALAVADLDDDGRVDLIYGNYDDDPRTDLLALSLSSGAATFSPRQLSTIHQFPTDFAFGDFDGDGRIDVFATQYNYSELFRNGLAFRSADFTIDAVLPEIVSIERATSQNAGNASTVAWIVMFGEAVTGIDAADFVLAPTGSFTYATIDVVQLTSSSYQVTVAGIVGSGALGLNLVDNGTIRDQAGNHLSPLRTSSQSNLDTYGPYNIVRGDLNGDGAVDLVYTNTFANYVSVLLGNGDGTFQARQSFAVTSRLGDVQVADLNGDGNPDLVVGRTSVSAVDLLFGNGDGSFQASQSVTLPATWESKSVVAADFNKDGKTDLLVQDFGSNGVLLLLGNGNGTFQQARTAGTVSANDMVVGDVNSDGNLDIVFDSAVLLGNGDGTFEARRDISNYSQSIALRDFNADGKLDLASLDSFAGTVDVALGNGDGTFGSRATFAVGINPWSVATGDVNGDGKIDLAVTNETSDNLSILFGNGDGTFQASRYWDSRSNPKGILIADLNGDGTDDVVTGNTFTPIGVSVLLALPHGTFVGKSYTIDTIAPTVTGIYARGVGSGSANWNASFLAYLAANNLGDASLGYMLSSGATQLKTLSWSNVNTISLRFSEELTIAQGDLSVIGAANGPAVPAITGFAWDAANHVGTWTFAAALPRGKFLLHLGGTLLDTVGNGLDGEWNVSSSMQSGNGTAGGDFNFRFNVLPSDFDGNNGVTITEVLAARNRAGKGTASVGYAFREDIDGNGNITITEVLQSRNRTATSITGLNEPVATGSTPQSPLELAPLIPGEEEGLYVSPYAALTEAELAPIVDEAIRRWESSDLVPQDFDWSKLRFAITDLGPAYLGLGNPDGSILLDDDGAGWGWFVDSSPTSDDEFASSTADAAAAAHMDLLTVVMHEIGHALGFPTGSAQDTPAAALMSELLGVGTRRTPGSAATDEGTGATVTEPGFAPSDLLASSGFDSGFVPTLSGRASGGTAPASQDYAIYALSSFTEENPALIEQVEESAKLRANKYRRTAAS